MSSLIHLFLSLLFHTKAYFVYIKGAVFMIFMSTLNSGAFKKEGEQFVTFRVPGALGVQLGRLTGSDQTHSC